MPLSSFEVDLQTLASVVREYLEKENGAPVITKAGLNQLVEEQFPDFKKKEISPGVYEIRIPRIGRQREMSLPSSESATQTTTDVNQSGVEGTTLPMVPKDGLQKLVNEQLPNLVQDESEAPFLDEFLFKLQSIDQGRFLEFATFFGRTTA